MEGSYDVLNDLDIQEEIHSDSVVDSTPQEPETHRENLIPLTAATTHPIRTLEIEYTQDLLEYPKSHEQGYTYVVQTGTLDAENVKLLMDDIQYSKAQVHPPKEIWCSFLQTRVTKYKYKCSGLKICEYLDENLRYNNHTEVTEELWNTIQAGRRAIQLVETDITKRNALSFARSIKQLFATGCACHEATATCKPKFGRHQYPDVTGLYRAFITCINASGQDASAHFYRSPHGHTQLDISFLAEIFEQELFLPTEKCGVMDQTRSNRKNCGFDHPGGSGKMVRLPCSVVFHIMIPLNLSSCQYMLFTSHGQHKHPPPPPNKPPATIMQRIYTLIAEMQNPSLKLSTFLTSPALSEFCQRYNSQSLAEIHQSFVNMDRFRTIIQKQRLLAYPAGQDYNGMLFELDRNENLKAYVCEIFHDEEGLMVVCMYKEQADLLLTLSSFEIDMSYKRIKSKKMNEVVFATYIQDHGKIITLCRVFTEQENPLGFYRLFKRVFKIVAELTSKEVLFYYLHNQGLHALIVDMCQKQMTGLARYLAEIDPENRPYSWQLSNILIFCRVHFYRSIDNTVGTQNKGIGVWNRMASLLDCESEEAYNTLCCLLLEEENKKVRDWVKHKRNRVIAAGINKYCSLISHSIYNSVRSHTNAAEQTHNKSYAFGKGQSLVAALLSAWKLDKRDILQYQARKDHGIHHGYRTDSMEANYARHVMREERVKRKHTEIQGLDGNDSEYLTTDYQSARQSIERTPTRQASSSISSRSRRSQSTQRTPSLQSPSIPPLRRVASTNLQDQDRERQQRQIDLERQRIEIEKMKQELRAAELANQEKELELRQRQAELENNYF